MFVCLLETFQFYRGFLVWIRAFFDSSSSKTFAGVKNQKVKKEIVFAYGDLPPFTVQGTHLDFFLPFPSTLTDPVELCCPGWLTAWVQCNNQESVNSFDLASPVWSTSEQSARILLVPGFHSHDHGGDRKKEKIELEYNRSQVKPSKAKKFGLRLFGETLFKGPFNHRVKISLFS